MAKHKHGDTRADGFRFFSYKKRAGKRIEQWANPESFAKLKQARKDRINSLRLRNPEKYRAFRERNRTANRQAQANYRAAKPEIIAKHNITRRTRQTSNEGNLKMIRQFYLISRRLTRCTGFAWHVDHITALAKGGRHHENNLQVLPARLNLKKGSK